MACDGTSGCGCSCVCSCVFPQVYYAFGIYDPPRPIPNTIALLTLPTPAGGGFPIAIKERPVIDNGGGGVMPPGVGSVPSIYDWGPKAPIPPRPPIRGVSIFKRRGWDGEPSLSPPPFEAMKGREPEPVLFAPATKAQGPREESVIQEVASLAPTYEIGDSSGSIQPWQGVPATAQAVRPPDARVGVEPPTPYSPAALAPPQSGEFLQGAGLGPGAGIGSEGSDPTEDNGQVAAMDTTVAEDAFPGSAGPEEAFPMEPGDATLGEAREPLRPPDFPGHVTEGRAGPALIPQARTTPSPFAGVSTAGGGSFRPHAGSRPSVRPGVGFSHGKTNPAFAVAVDKRMEEMQARDSRNETLATRDAATRNGDAEGVRSADAKLQALKESEATARKDGDAAARNASGSNAGADSVSRRSWDEAIRRRGREEANMRRLSVGSGDVAAARRAQADLRLAIQQRDRATALAATVSSARQGDRMRTAESSVRQSHERTREIERAAGNAKDPDVRKLWEGAAAAARKEEQRRKDVLARTKKEAGTERGRQAYRDLKQKAKGAAKEARKAAQEARKSARREKDAARYGPASAVTRAQQDSDAKKKTADQKMRDAEALAKALQDPAVPLEGADAQNGVIAGSGGGGPGVSCVCKPPCPEYSTCLCTCKEEPEGDGGGKGRFLQLSRLVAPPDSGFQMMMLGPDPIAGDSLDVLGSPGDDPSDDWSKVLPKDIFDRIAIPIEVDEEGGEKFQAGFTADELLALRNVLPIEERGKYALLLLQRNPDSLKAAAELLWRYTPTSMKLMVSEKRIRLLNKDREKAWEDVRQGHITPAQKDERLALIQTKIEKEQDAMNDLIPTPDRDKDAYQRHDATWRHRMANLLHAEERLAEVDARYFDLMRKVLVAKENATVQDWERAMTSGSLAERNAEVRELERKQAEVGKELEDATRHRDEAASAIPAHPADRAKPPPISWERAKSEIIPAAWTLVLLLAAGASARVGVVEREEAQPGDGGALVTTLPRVSTFPQKWPKQFKTHQEFGEQGMGWGRGQDEGVRVTREATAQMTKEGLRDMGLTRVMAGEWASFYTQAVAEGKGGVQGIARRDMFQRAVELLGR